MPKTYKKKSSKVSTRKNSLPNSSMRTFQKQITVVFLEMLIMVKLFHWKTHSYAIHKATDDLYSSLNENIDHFIEVLLGKTGSRIDLMSHKSISLIDLTSNIELKRELDKFKEYLVSLNTHSYMKQMSNTDLYNIRDEMLANINQFLYLLSFL